MGPGKLLIKYYIFSLHITYYILHNTYYGTPVGAHVHKTTYAPMLYTALCKTFLMGANPLLGQVGGDWALEISTFLGPKWHSSNGSMPFHRPKSLDF